MLQKPLQYDFTEMSPHVHFPNKHGLLKHRCMSRCSYFRQSSLECDQKSGRISKKTSASVYCVCGPLTEDRLRSRTCLTAALSMSDGLYSQTPLSVCLSSHLSDSLHLYTDSKSHIPPPMKHVFIRTTKRINFPHSDVSGLIF